MTEKLTEENIHTIVRNTAKFIEENYPYPEVAQKMAFHIQKELSAGSYIFIKKPGELAQHLTKELRGISHDLHISVIYSPKGAAQIKARREMDQLDEKYESDWWEWVHCDNFGITKIEYLTGNIGYVNIRYFAPVNLAGDIAVAAMNFLAGCNALIFDLRECDGGDPFMTQIFQSYLFDKDKKPKLLLTKYHHAREEYHQKWTYPFIPGKRFPDIPVYILTSHRTFSGGEDMAYTLKHHKRATIVGETTGGGAHPITELTPGEGFVVIMPEGYPIHPVTKGNWEGIGVKPDIEVPKEFALETAHRHAIQSFLKKNTDPAKAHTYNWYLQRLDAIYRPLKLDITSLKKYTGQYRDYEVKIESDSLVLSPIGKEIDWPMIPISKHTFTGDDDYNVRFEMGEEEKAVALVWLGRDSSKEIRIKRTG